MRDECGNSRMGGGGGGFISLVKVTWKCDQCKKKQFVSAD